MNTLVIYTYPNHESLNYSFLEHTLQGLKRSANKNDIQVLDLYAENFNPVLVFNQDHKRRDMATDPELEKYRQQLLWADQLVFIYPIWWGRPPAMLLGYFDRLLATGFAYRHKESSPIPEGLIKNKSAICISTMKGPTLYPLFFHGNAHKNLMKRAVFNFIGIKKVKFFEMGGMEKKDGKQTKNLQKISHYFERQAN